MKKLSVQRASELLNAGITHIVSVVKSHYTTTYYNVNSIDAILRNNGRWIAAPSNSHGWHGPVGVTRNQVDWDHAIPSTKI